MIRCVVGAVVGLVVGVALAVGLLAVTKQAVPSWLTAPREFEVERWVIYLGVLLGAGFGAVTGALAGLGAALVRALRERPISPSPPPGPNP